MNSSGFNKRFFVVFLLVSALTLSGYFALHSWQVRKQTIQLMTIADRYAAEGKTGRALRTINRYLLSNPKDYEARLRFARLMLDANPDPAGQAQAFEALKSVLEQEPGRDDVRLEIVKILVKFGRWREAVGELETLEKSPLKDVWIIQMLGQANTSLKNWEGVVRVLKPLCMDAKSPDTADYSRLAGAYRALSDSKLADAKLANVKLADAVIEKLVSDYADKPDGYLIRAAYRENYKIPGAEADLDLAKKIAPTNPAVALALAGRALNRNDPQAAMAELKAAMTANPADVRLLKMAAAVEAKVGRPHETVKLLRRAFGLKSQDAELAVNIAQALVDVGDWNGVKEQLETISKLKGADVVEVDLLKARLSLEAGEWAIALPKLEQIARIYENEKQKNTDAIYALIARCAGLAGDTESQIEAARKAAQNRNPAGVLIYAAYLAEAGRYAEATRVYQQMLRSPQAPPEAAFGLAQLLVMKHGAPDAKSTESDWVEVDNLLQRAATIVPNAPEIPILRAEAFLAQNKADQVRKILRDARTRLPKSVSLWAASAAAEAKAGKLPEAFALLEQGKKIAGDSADLRLTALRIQFTNNGDKDRALEEIAKDLDKLSEADKLRVWVAQAEGYELLKKPEKTAAALDNILSVKPNDLRTLVSRFDTAIRLKDEESAIRVTETIQKLEGKKGPIGPYLAAYRIVRGVQENPADTSRLAEARKYLNEVDSRKENWAKSALLRAELEELDGHPELAVGFFESAHQQGERSFTLLRRLLDYYTQQRRFRDASKLLNNLQIDVRLNSTQSRAFAEIHLQAPDFAHAYDLARQAVDDSTNNSDDVLWLARISILINRPLDEVDRVLKQAIALAPDSAAAWAIRIGYLRSTNRVQEARKLMDEIAKSKDTPNPASILAPCHEVLDEIDQAEEAYLRAMEKSPDDLRLAQSAAVFFSQASRHGKTEPILRRIVEGKLKASPEEVAVARRELAIALGAMGRNAEGLALIDQNQVANSPTHPADIRAKAKVLAQNRLTQYTAFQLLDNEFDRRKFSASDLFLFAKLGLAIDQFARAKEAMVFLLNKDEENINYLEFWIEALLDRNELPDARFYLARLVKTRPGTLSTIRLQALVAYKANSKLAEARRSAEAADRLRGYEPKSLLEEAQLSRAYEEIGAYPEAETRIREYARKSGSPLAQLAVARYLARRSQYGPALDIADAVRKAAGTDLIATVAQDMLRSGENPADPKEVRRVEAWIAESKSPPAKPWMNDWLLGEFADIRGDTPLAIGQFHKALSVEPNQSFVVPGLTRLLCLTGKPSDAAEAERILTETLKLTPLNADELAELQGLAYLKQGQTQKAIDQLLGVMMTAPSQKGSLYLMAALMAAGQFEDAEKVRQRANIRGIKTHEWHRLEKEWWQKLVTELPEKLPKLKKDK